MRSPLPSGLPVWRSGRHSAKHTLKGDQLILEARVQSNNLTDGQGHNHYDYSFVVTGFRFGAPGAARREIFDGSGEVDT